jgi:hypothetical protein
MIYFSFLYYYLGKFGPAIFVLYYAAVFQLRKIDRVDLIYLMVIGLHFIRLFSMNGFFNGLITIRYFWGFLFFYLYFCHNKFTFNKRLIIFLAGSVVFETVLVNRYIAASDLPNYPAAIEESHFAQEGAYQRSYGFGGNATITAVLLSNFAYLSQSSYVKNLLRLTSLLCLSGTGIIHLVFSNIKHIFSKKTFALFSLAFILISSDLIPKISSSYLTEVYDDKIYQIQEELSASALLWGVSQLDSVRQLGGDFSMLSFLEYNGLIGFFLLIVIPFRSYNNIYRKPIFLLLVCSCHYGVIFSLPGQVVFGYLLARHKHADHPEDTTVNRN